MPRGGPGKSSHTVSVRLTPAELEAWRERQQRSGRRELGAWARAVINDAQGLTDGRQAGDVPQIPEANHAAYRQLAGAAQNLNQVARALNAGHPAGAEVAQAAAAVRDAARAVTGR